MFKILLVSIQSDSPIMQLAPFYIKAYLHKHTSLNRSDFLIDIQVFSRGHTPEEVAKTITKERPNLVGFSCYLWNIEKTLNVTKILKKENFNLITVLGGPEVSPRANEILEKESSLNFIVRGEGEETFKCLIESIINKQEPLKIKGISFRKENKIYSMPQRSDIENLDSIPSPYLEGLITDKKDLSYPVTETMRGCPFKCHFCYYHKEFKRVRFFSLNRVGKELQYILSKRPKEIYLMDPTFNVNPQRAKKILKIFIRHNINSHLHVELKAELLDRETIKLLDKANCKLIEIGLQSINPKPLKFINRHFDINKFKENINLLNKCKNTFFQIQLIDSLPGESYKDFLKSINWTISLKPANIKIMRLSLLPGSYLQEHAKEFGLQYNYKPPYHSYKSDAMSESDLFKIKRLRRGLEQLYNNGSFKNTLYKLTDLFQISFSDIFDEWYYFSQKNTPFKKIEDYLHAYRDFIKKLCKKYNKLYYYQKLYRVMMSDVLSLLYFNILKKQRAVNKRF